MKWVLTNIRCTGNPRKLNMAVSIVSSAAKELGSLVGGEVKYLYEVSDKIERLQSDLLWMRCFLQDADNKEQQQKVVGMWISKIRDLADEAQEIIERYVHQVAHHRRNGKCNTVKWLSCCLCDAPALHDVGSKIDDLRIRKLDLIFNLQLCGVNMTELGGTPQYNLAMREQSRTYSHTKDYPIGLENHIQEVVKQLVERNEVKVVGIFGIGGLGKTTLARQIFSHKAIKEYFGSNCVWVFISKQFERKAIFQEILLGLKCTSAGKDDNKDEKASNRLEKLRDKDDNKDYKTRNRIEKLREVELLKEIRKVLMEKKCLVVLDNMWRNVDWNCLSPAFESIRDCDSKILITTRNKSLVEYAEGYSYRLGFLSPADSWKLLERILFSTKENSGEAPTLRRHQTDETELHGNKEITSSHHTTNSKTTSKQEGQAVQSPKFGTEQIDQTELQGNEVPHKKSLAMEMLEHCNSLPLAIRTLGGVLLNKKTISEWQTVQKNISYYLMNNMVEDNHELYAVLESSYNDLPNYLKRYFLYLGMFPEDHEIEAEELFHLWEAEGLVTASLDGGDELQGVLLDDIAEMYLNQLVERSMVQVEKSWPNGRIRSCRLHDIMQDMCLKKCREGNFLHIIERDSSMKSSNQVVRVCPPNRRMRRCALHCSANLDSLVHQSLSDSTPCIRSLLVFPHGNGQPGKVLSRKMRKFFSLVRVLYLPKADIPPVPTVLGDYIHIRFLCLRGGGWFFDLPRRIWDCKYLETLDLEGCKIVSLSNKFRKLERLRHLYLPSLRRLKGSWKLDLTIIQLRQMETYKAFDVQKCRIGDLLEMTKLRNFSITGQVSEKDLEVLLLSPVIIFGRLVNPLSLGMEAAVINEAPSILVRMVSHNIHISDLEITGSIEVPLGGSVDANVQIFPHTLVHLTLRNCRIGKEGISILGKLPLLEYLDLRRELSGGDHKMSFRDGSFPSLDTLNLYFMDNLKEWEVREDALPNLRFPICASWIYIGVEH